MSTKPTTAPAWDSNSTNLTAPTAGHQANGWAVDEVPTSTEMNGWQQNVSSWAVFLNAMLTDGGAADINADVGNPAEATVLPIWKHRDYANNIRSLVDHNGFRMGQVTELDEVWNAAPVTIEVPMAQMLPSSASWVLGITAGWQIATNGSLSISLGGLVPPGALITSVAFDIQRGTASDVTTFDIFTNTQTTLVTSVQKGVTTGTGQSIVALFTAPSTGHGPYQMPPSGSSVDDVLMQVTASSVVSSFHLYGVALTYVMPPPGWSWTGATTDVVSATVGDQFAMVDPQSGLNQRGVQLLSTAVTNAGGSVLNSNYETYIDANCAYVTEYMVKPGVITDGSNHRQFLLGLQGSLGLLLGLYNDATETNWQLYVSGTKTDTGVAIVAATVYRFRLEIFGANVSSAGAGNAKIRVYLNGTKVVETNVAFTADKFRPYFQCSTTTTSGGPYDITIGRVRRAWNHLASGDNL